MALEQILSYVDFDTLVHRRRLWTHRAWHRNPIATGFCLSSRSGRSRACGDLRGKLEHHRVSHCVDGPIFWNSPSSGGRGSTTPPAGRRAVCTRSATSGTSVPTPTPLPFQCPQRHLFPCDQRPERGGDTNDLADRSPVA